MSNQLQTKGGAQPSKQNRYGVLWQGRFYGGIVTQRSPLRGNLGHLEEEFYGNQNDIMIDGLNAEISSKLTAIRRPGQTIYNNQTFPPVNRFYSNRTIEYNASQTFATESIQIIADTASAVYDATGPSTQKSLFSKTTGAGSTFFQSVGNSLYFTDGPDQKKLITPSLIWAANQNFQVGNQILDSNGNLEVVQGTGSATITDIQVIDSNLGIPGRNNYFLKITFSSNVYWTANTPVSFSGVTTYTSLNGQTLLVSVDPHYLIPAADVAYFPSPTPTLYGPAADTGTATSTTNTGGGESGGSVPTWNAALGGLTTDGQLTWQNFGVPLYNWATTPPANPPTLSTVPGTRFWQANTAYAVNYSVLDNNGNVQLVTTAGTSGTKIPVWGTSGPFLQTVFTGTVTTLGSSTQDGSVTWLNCGAPSTWNANSTYPKSQVILDSNGNWQEGLCPGVSYGTSGSTEPTWATTIGTTTADNTISWVCLGPGTVLTSGQVQYAYSWVSVDGSVTTPSPLAIQNFTTSVVGPANSARAELTGTFPTDPQIAFAWVWRTVQGGSTLFFDAAIPNPSPGTITGWFFVDVVPDTSLNELIEAPIDDLNNPPPVGLGALTYHLDCVFGALGNTVRYSDGPLTPSGNGNTAWSPGNVFVFPSTVVVLFPTSSGLLVFTTSDIYIIQGLNTSSSPLYSVPFLQNIGLLSYDAFTVNGSIVYLYTSDNQVLCLDPSAGVSEVGFPIGDQFGPFSGTETFTPSSAHVTWHIAGSQDKGLYVSDFAGVWWRMCPTPSPESGTTWSPRASIVGGFSAVQSVETSPGIRNLLVGPAVSGPILQRNYQVYSDNGSAYPAFAILGSLVLAQPGQLAMVESLTTDSIAIGTPLTLAVQLDEISSVTGLSGGAITNPGIGYSLGDLVVPTYPGSSGGIFQVTGVTNTGQVTSIKLVAPGIDYVQAALPVTGGTGTGLNIGVGIGGLFEALDNYVPDPTELEPSLTLYAQRFYLSQTQKPAVCRHLQIQINWGSDVVKNELLSLSLFGAFEQEK